MSKVHAIYKMPKDDSPVTEMRGVRFFDGQPVELDSDEDAALIAKLRTNQHFEVEGGEAAAQTADGSPLTGLAKARAAKAAKKQQNL